MGVISSVGLTFLAYAGYGVMANAAGEVSDPERTIPRAIFLAIIVVIVLYVGLALVVVDSISSTELMPTHEHSCGGGGSSSTRLVWIRNRVDWRTTGDSLGDQCICIQFDADSVGISRGGATAAKLRPTHLGDGTRGLLGGVAGVLLMINVFNLNAIANISSASFLIVYLAIQVAHWRLIDKTKGSRFLVAIGFLSMALVLACFLWSIAFTQPWSVGLIVLFVAGSWVIEALLAHWSSAAPGFAKRSLSS